MKDNANNEKGGMGYSADEDRYAPIVADFTRQPQGDVTTRVDNFIKSKEYGELKVKIVSEILPSFVKDATQEDTIQTITSKAIAYAEEVLQSLSEELSNS